MEVGYSTGKLNKDQMVQRKKNEANVQSVQSSEKNSFIYDHLGFGLSLDIEKKDQMAQIKKNERIVNSSGGNSSIYDHLEIVLSKTFDEDDIVMSQ